MDDRNYCLVLSEAEAKELQTALHWMLEAFGDEGVLRGIHMQVETLRMLTKHTSGGDRNAK